MTASVSPPVTMAPPGQALTSAAPQAAGVVKDNRFSEELSRKLKRDDDAPDADAAVVPVPDADAANRSASTQTALEPAALNAHIAAQASLAAQGANPPTDETGSSRPSDLALSHAQTGTRLGTGRTLPSALRTTHAAAPGDVNPESLALVDDGDSVGQASAHGTSRLTAANKPQTAATSLTHLSAPTPAHISRAKSADATAATLADTQHARAQDVSTQTMQAMERLADGATNQNGINPAHNALTLAQPMQSANAPDGLPTLGTGAIAVPLHHPQWSEALGQQVLHMSHAGTQAPQTAELRLDPPELGPLRITIALNNDVAHASFVSAHAPVRLAVENALPQLQEQLAQAGISLGQTSVSDQGSFRQEASAHEDAPFTINNPIGHPAPPSAHQPTAVVRNTHALIDTFA